MKNKRQNKSFKPPVFITKETDGNIDPGLAELGLRLSKELPTYDVPIDLIRPNHWNVNEMNDKMFNRLVEEMETSGIVDPIQIVPAEGGQFLIIGGENRWHGAKTLGWETIPANVLTDEKFLDEDLQKFLSVRLNVIRGEPAPEKFVALYEEVAERYGEAQLKTLFGYTSGDAWKKVTSEIKTSLSEIKSITPEIIDKFDKKAKKARSVDDLGSILRKIFKEHGSDLDYSFMVFVYGGRKHFYIVMDDNMKKIIDNIADICRKQKKDMNDILLSALREYLP